MVKDEAKTQVAVSHRRLAGAEAGQERKVYWRQAMADLKRLLESWPTGERRQAGRAA